MNINNKLFYTNIFFFLFLFIKTSFAFSMFDTEYIEVNFESSNIEASKNDKIKELTVSNLNSILKKILTKNNYKKIRNKIDYKLSNSLIKNIIIENEKILNSRYSASIKINYDYNLLVNFLRQNKLSYVESIPNNFFLIIIDDNGIKKNLFSDDNKYYDFLKKNNDQFLNFYMIPNLDINDRFLATPNEILNMNQNTINKIKNKYNIKNLIVIHSENNSNVYKIDIYLDTYSGFKLIKQFSNISLDLNNFFIDLKSTIIDSWKQFNNIQNDTITLIDCYVNALNIYELKEINSLLESISVIEKYELKKIKLYQNMYEISYYGNIKILKSLFDDKLMKINIVNDKCEIFLK